MRVLLLGMLRMVVLLIIIVARLWVETLTVRVALWLYTYSHTCARLFRNRAGCSSGASRWLEHGGILKLRNGSIGRIIVVLLTLRVGIIIRVRHRILLRRLATCTLWLTGCLQCDMLL